jgi:hypothetical protein
MSLQSFRQDLSESSSTGVAPSYSMNILYFASKANRIIPVVFTPMRTMKLADYLLHADHQITLWLGRDYYVPPTKPAVFIGWRAHSSNIGTGLYTSTYEEETWIMKVK